MADVGDHDGTDAAAYVLKDFNASEHKELEFLLPEAADAVELLIERDLTYAQNLAHVDPRWVVRECVEAGFQTIVDYGASPSCWTAAHSSAPSSDVEQPWF